MQFQSKHIRHDFSRDVICGRTKPAGHKQNFGTRKQLRQCITNRFTIGNRAPLRDAQTQGENLLRDKRKMRIVHITQQKLCAGVEKIHSHFAC